MSISTRLTRPQFLAVQLMRYADYVQAKINGTSLTASEKRGITSAILPLSSVVELVLGEASTGVLTAQAAQKALTELIATIDPKDLQRVQNAQSEASAASAASAPEPTDEDGDGDAIAKAFTMDSKLDPKVKAEIDALASSLSELLTEVPTESLHRQEQIKRKIKWPKDLNGDY